MRAQSNVRICNIFAIQAVTNRNHFHRQTKMPYLEETMEQEIILEARNITKVYPGGVVANHNVNLQIKRVRSMPSSVKTARENPP